MMKEWGCSWGGGGVEQLHFCKNPVRAFYAFVSVVVLQTHCIFNLKQINVGTFF